MREQNVKALTKLLRAAGTGTRDPGLLAEWLVETGAVVVPGAITDEEAMDLLHNRPEEPLGAIEDMDGEWLRECLRRIATTPATPVGEPEAVPHLKGAHVWGLLEADTAPTVPPPGYTPDS